MNRRQFLIASAGSLTALRTLRAGAVEQQRNGMGRSKIPLLHITDLYHPPQDPDDHFDLATIAALEEFELRGVILDPTERFLNPSPGSADQQRDPGFVPVSQLAYILGRDIPVATGPKSPLLNARDDAMDRPEAEQAGVRLLLEILERSTSSVVISVVGSCRVITAAFNRNPELLRAQIRAVLLNAGSSGPSKEEWNVGLDSEAYKGLWYSGLPIHWYPCSTERGAFDQDHERGTYWKTTHRVLLDRVSLPMQSWFTYALTNSNRGDIIRVLSEKPSDTTWDDLLAKERNLWSTASLIMSAGRILAKTDEGWRFAAADAKTTAESWPWRLDPIDASVDDHAEVHWNKRADQGNAFIFGRKRGDNYARAMGEALGSLLASL
jgi:pyrimidine-specific ribonucleoside hydrolase